MDKTKIYTANKIFDGENWLSDAAIVVKKNKITEILPISNLPKEIEVQDFGNKTLAPAFIDLQIYGAYGKLLSVFPTIDALSQLNSYCRNGGAAYCVPTVATNHLDVFKKVIDAIRDYWKQGGQGILGIHLEGPWLNPIKRGAHIESLIHQPTIEEVKEILDYGKGVITMITIAPEECSDEVIKMILDEGIIISAGHSNATFDEAKEGFNKGIQTVTHLYNAMSPFMHRDPGLAGAAMVDSKAMASIIPDGYHCDYAAIKIAKAAMKDRLFVITDAVTDTNSGAYQHELDGDKYIAAGILSGSALTMFKSVCNLVKYCNIDWGEAIRMCSLYPAKLYGISHKLGRLKPGYDAEIIAIDMEKEDCVFV